MDEEYGFGLNNDNNTDVDTDNSQTDTSVTSVSNGVYSSRHYDYSNAEGKATYTTGSAGSGSPYYSRPDTENYRDRVTETSSTVVTAGNGTGGSADSSDTFGSDKPRKKKGGAGRFWGRVFAVIGTGILFGLAAGATIFILNKGLGAVGTTENAVTEEIEEKEEKADKEEKSEKKVDKGVKEEPSDLSDDALISSKIESDTDDPSGIIVTDVSDMVDNTMPSIVSITGKYVVTGQSFWGQTYSEETEGSGSGIIIAEDDDMLYIATNNHVVEDSETLKVQFIDGKTAEATIKGTDVDKDLAVIMVDIDDIESDTRNAIKVANLGNSDDIKIGEPAVVIGNSLGYGQTVTYGVISAVNRTLEMDDGTVSNGLIQTDAAINPGNSGGALLNISGEVIGISSSKIGGAVVDGVGFAIPISSAQPILSDIVTRVERTKVAEGKQGYLGIGGQTVTDEVSQMYGLPVGVLVRQVYEGTGAEESGLMQGDVITAIEGTKIGSMEELREELQYYSKGDEISVTVSRMDGGEYEEMTFEIKLVSKDDLN